MGYWQTNDEGHSFAEGFDGDEPMIWGDAPADAMDDALDAIIAAFRSDLGRAPSLRELKAGLLFSAQCALEGDEKRREEAQLYTYEVVSKWTWTDFDGKPSSSLESSFYDGTSADDVKSQYEADRDLEFDARVGMTRELISVEQIEPTRAHKARGTLTVVKDEG